MIHGRHDWGTYREMYEHYCKEFKEREITEIEFLSNLMKIGFLEKDAKTEARLIRPEG